MFAVVPTWPWDSREPSLSTKKPIALSMPKIRVIRFINCLDRFSLLDSSFFLHYSYYLIYSMELNGYFGLH